MRVDKKLDENTCKDLDKSRLKNWMKIDEKVDESRYNIG